MQCSRAARLQPPRAQPPQKAGRRAGSRHPRSRNSSARLDEGCARHSESRGDTARVYFEEKRCHGETSAIISPAIISPSWHGWRLPPPAAPQRCSPRCSPTPLILPLLPTARPRSGRQRAATPDEINRGSPAMPGRPPLRWGRPRGAPPGRSPAPAPPLPPRPRGSPAPCRGGAGPPMAGGAAGGRQGSGQPGPQRLRGWGWHGLSGLSSSLGEARGVCPGPPLKAVQVPSLPCSVSAAPRSLVSAVNVLRVRLRPLSLSQTEVLCPKTDP